MNIDMLFSASVFTDFNVDAKFTFAQICFGHQQISPNYGIGHLNVSAA